MGKVYAELDERLVKFISRQPLFFVATAPSLTPDGEGGHVNLSPKGYKDTVAVLGPRSGLRRPYRERGGDHRSPAAERPDYDHVLLVRETRFASGHMSHAV